MKSQTLLVFLLGAVVSQISPVARAAQDDDGYNEVTIRPSDLPPDAPRFESFPAKRYAGKNAAVDLSGSPLTKLFRTRIKEWSKEKPNFAGHYILATWGCGSDCTQLAIIDAITGKVFHPPGVTSNVAVNVHQKLLEGGDFWHASGAIKFHLNSRLLILIGAPEEDVKRRGISYYVWNENHLSLVRFVPKAWYPE